MSARRRPDGQGHRRRRLSLRTRAMAAFGAGAALVSTSLALITFAVARHDLLSQRQASTLRQAFVNARLVKQDLEAPSADVVDVLSSLATADGVRALVYRNHLWFSTSVSIGRQSIPTAMTRAVLAGNVAEQRIFVGGSPAIAVGVPIPSIHLAYFEIHSMAELQGTLGTLAVVLTATAVAVTLGGTILGLWVSGRLVRPLSGTARVAGEIAAGSLDRRLPPDPDLGPLVESFNGMVTSLQQRIERDARFAADLSHELRSPLTTVGASVELVDLHRGSLPVEGRTAVDILKLEVERFSVMVQDLLEISRMDAGSARMSFEPVPIDELVGLTVTAHCRHVEVEVLRGARGSLVAGDKRRLQRVVANLLDNADAHAGGAVLVSVDRRDAWVEIAVEDRGPGVPAQERGRIFERFYRGSAAGRRGTTAGTGLGLALVAEHVRAHEGIVRVESPTEGGARFVVALPVLEP